MWLTLESFLDDQSIRNDLNINCDQAHGILAPNHHAAIAKVAEQVAVDHVIRTAH